MVRIVSDRPSLDAQEFRVDGYTLEDQKRLKCLYCGNTEADQMVVCSGDGGSGQSRAYKCSDRFFDACYDRQMAIMLEAEK